MRRKSEGDKVKFKIGEEFYFNGKAQRVISGAVHYFRLTPGQWESTLYNLKALGANTVETYIPWNLHEPKEGQFNFEGIADLEAFLELAHSMGLYSIVRPSPYICAEWEFGGLPAWLLKDKDLRVRSRSTRFMSSVETYYKNLIPRLLRFQTTRGGNMLMVQVENEYGTFANDKKYMIQHANLLRAYGIDVPLVTSDGGVFAALEAGTLPELNVLATVNFGSNANDNFTALKEYQRRHDRKEPLMCMEFWNGWFNNWGKNIIRRDVEETAKEVRAVLEQGSINFYMFQGGTNFGFYNGCSDNQGIHEPQITSYDYDALLTEWGAPTDKYFAIQKVIKDLFPHIEIKKPRYPIQKKLGTFKITKRVSLFFVLDQITNKIKSDYPLSMEELAHYYGYVLYKTQVQPNREVKELKIVDARDRVQLFVNQQLVTTQQYNEIGKVIKFNSNEKVREISLLLENLGRNNYGPSMRSSIQYKGLLGGVFADLHLLMNWEHYAIDFNKLNEIDYELGFLPETPSFYQVTFTLEEAESTFIDCSHYGKGIIIINGFNLGRYWNVGPSHHLFVPKDVLKIGENECVIFETEGKIINKVHFVEDVRPLYTMND